MQLPRGIFAIFNLTATDVSKFDHFDMNQVQWIIDRDSKEKLETVQGNESLQVLFFFLR